MGCEEATEQSYLQKEVYLNSLEGRVRQTTTR